MYSLSPDDSFVVPMEDCSLKAKTVGQTRFIFETNIFVSKVSEVQILNFRIRIASDSKV